MYYKHSGRFSIAGLIFGAAVGCAGALILAYAYGRGSIFIDDERFSFLATTAFGGLIGACAGYGLVWGKVRNHTANLIVQGVVSTLGLYFGWAVWVVDIFRRFQVETPGWIEYAQRPGLLWRAICYINQYGTWSFGQEGVTKGPALWTVWVAEAALVIGLAMSIGYEILGNHAFCERCESWCRRGAKLILSSPQNPSQLKRQLEVNDWRWFENLRAGNKATDHLVVTLDSCDQCRQLHTMSLTHVAVCGSRVRKAKIVQHLLIDQAQAQNLQQLSMKVTQAGKMTAPKATAAATGKN